MEIDKKLIASCIAQERAAQKELYQLLLPYLRGIANRYLRDTSYEKDALQESYLKIFKSIDQYDFDLAPLPVWAGRITINQCINYNKRVIGIPNEELKVEQHEASSRPAVLEKWSNENMLYILKQMPIGYYEVFNLFVIDGYSHEEIADLLGISEVLSRKRLSRSRTWLKKYIQDRPGWRSQFSFSSFFSN